MRKVAFLLALIFVALGCGGGGGGATESTFTSTITVPTSGTTTTVEKIILEFPPNTFSNPTPVTLTESVQPNSMPTNHYARVLGPAINLEAGAQANQDVTALFPDPGGSIDGFMTALTDGSDWYTIEPFKENGRIKVQLPAELINSGNGRAVFDGLTAFLVKIASPPLQSRFVHLSGVTDYSNAVVLVHGWQDRIESFRPFANRLTQTGTYGSVYGFEYDWASSVDENAQDFAEILDEIYVQTGEKNLDIIAHSMGGLVTRSALETHSATAAVRNCFFACTPNTGTTFGDNMYLLTFFLRELILENFWGSGMATVDTVSLQQMRPNSDFLSSLNSFSNQTGKVNYYLYDGQWDLIVGQAGRANSVDIEELTGGTVVRDTLPGGHSYAVKDLNGIEEFISKIQQELGQQPRNDVDFSVWPTVMDPESDGRHWQYDFQVQNNSSLNVVVQDIMLELYDANGEWVGTWWVDPNTTGGEFFPTNYTAINMTLGSGNSYTDGIAIYAGQDRPLIASAPVNRRRQTTVMTVRFERDGEEHLSRELLFCRYLGAMPETAQTRSRNSSVSETGGFAFVRK